MKTRIFFFAAATLLASCQKDKNVTTIDDMMVSNENTSSLVEKSTSELEDAVTLRSGSSQCQPMHMLPECAEITGDTADYPKDFYIDFGSGCTDFHGRVHAGTIHVTVTGDMIQNGSVSTVSFENYSVNGVAISGSRTTTSNGLGETGQPVFSRVANMTIQRPQGTFVRTFSGTITWIAGFNTPECNDNVFQETGSGSVTRPNGVVVNRTIIEPLIIDRACGYITSGTVEMSGPNGTATLNFGDGSCNDQAVITRPNGETEVITLQH